MKKTALILLIAITYSCAGTDKNKEVQTINIDLENIRDEVKLSEIASSVQFLPLSLPNSPIIGNIRKVQQKNNHIYISDRDGIYAFNNKGNFINKIAQKGEGPNQYLSISDFTIDEKDLIWILSMSNKKLIQYDWNGNVKQTLALNHWVSKFVMFEPTKMCLFAGNNMDENNKHELSILDTKTGKIESNYLSIDENKAKYLHGFSENNFTEAKNGVYFYKMFADTIYSTIDREVSAKYLINYNNNKNIPESFFDSKYSNIMEFFMKLNNHDYARGITVFIKNGSKSIVGCYYNSKSLLCFNDDEKTISSSTFIDDICLDGFSLSLSENGVFSIGDNTLAIPVWADEMEPYVSNMNAQEREAFEKKYGKFNDDSSYLMLIKI